MRYVSMMVVVVLMASACVEPPSRNSSEPKSFTPYEAPDPEPPKDYGVTMEDVMDQWGLFKMDEAPEGEVLRVVHTDGTSEGVTATERWKDWKRDTTDMVDDVRNLWTYESHGSHFVGGFTAK